jgi:trehalose-6-phosphate synthase
VIVSKQSGAAEVLEHALKVDFWDVEETASKILSVLRDPTLAKEMASRGSFEVRQMRWSDAADAVAGVYDRLLRNQAVGS